MGQTIDEIQTKKIARYFSFATVAYLDKIMTDKAIVCLKRFFADSMPSSKFRYQVYKTMTQIINIQKKIKSNLVTRYAKVEVLVNYWDKMIGQTQLRASRLKDKKTSDLCLKIILIPKQIQKAILKNYVTACRNVYAMAFFQWRMMYPNNVRHSEEELNEILVERIANFSCNMIKISSLNDEDKDQPYSVPKDFLARYKMDDEIQPFDINCFESICWADPFPNEV